MVRHVYLIVGLMLCGLLAGIARADAFKLTSGETLNGEALIGTANDQGVKIKLGEGQYQLVPWASFSQEDLKQFEQNQKLAPFVEPFIEITQVEKSKRTEVKVQQPPRLERPARQSLCGALLSSGLGWVIVLLLYAANIYAGYEVAIFRARPPLVVAGVSAVPVLGFLAPIVFLCIPMKAAPAEEFEEQPLEPAAAEAGAAATEAGDADNPMQAAGVEHPTGLKLAHSEAEAAPKAREPVIYQRGQSTFNRRFFETKLQPFFGIVRREEDRGLIMTIKSSRGEYVGQRISRIAANDLHIQVQRGHASEEIMIPFQEVLEVRIQDRAALGGSKT